MDAVASAQTSIKAAEDDAFNTIINLNNEVVDKINSEVVKMCDQAHAVEAAARQLPQLTSQQLTELVDAVALKVPTTAHLVMSAMT